ncbi:MAG TPA: hypothetical protein DCF45_09205 [Gammaproteobacteria bacterium]|nr:hypothetical protein [Gammaproteobacteria bacterium]
MAPAADRTFTDLTALGIRSVIILFVVTLGATLAALGPLISPIIPPVAVVAIIISIVSVLQPRYGVLLLIFLISFVEEFRGGISTDMFERSERTFFYARTLGIPTLYAPDVIIGGLLAVFLIREIFLRRGLPLHVDRISVALALICLAVALSLFFSYIGPEPFGPSILDLSLVGSIELPEEVARLIAILQYKLFLLFVPTYLLGLFYFNSEQDIKNLLRVVSVAMIGTIALASLRLIRDPSLVTQLVAIIYDTASVWLMALTVFYNVGMWGAGKYTSSQTIVRGIFCLLLILFILLSFRRTLWGAIALATLFYPLILAPKSYAKVLALSSIAAIVALMVLGGTSIGQALLSSVLARLGETNFNEASTLYRFALLVWFVERSADLPLFGYGLKPLWNEQIRLRFFVTHMENVHSLYFWILLRLGPVGFFMSMISLGLILSQIRRLFHMLTQDYLRLLVGVIFLGIIMILFSGIFNPVYGRTRFIVPMAFLLAMLSRLPYILDENQRVASSGDRCA